MSSVLRIATFNIRNTTDRYSERSSLLADEIQNISSDIIGFQEVCWSQIPLLYEAFGTAGIICQSACRDPILSNSKPDYRVDGDMLLVKTNFDKIKITVEKQDVLILSFERIVQKVVLSIKYGFKKYSVCVSNTHLHNGLSREDILERERQCEIMMDWIEKDKYDAYIVMGDFNADHNDNTYHYMESLGYLSGYKAIHGNEPEKTFPSGLKAPTMDTSPEYGCIDYIWLKGFIKCLVIMNIIIWIIGKKRKLEWIRY